VAPPGPSCASGTVAILAGDDTKLTAAVQSRGGAWGTWTVNGGAAKSKPALVAFGGAFLGVSRGPNDNLQTTTFTGTWSDAATFGNSGVKGAPSLTVTGTKAHVVYSAGDNAAYAHGIHDGTSWNAATEAVGPPPSVGTVSAGLVGVGTELVMLENGFDNAGLYERSWTGSWGASNGVFGAGTVGPNPAATPEAVAVTGAFDVVAVYVKEGTHSLWFATRDSTSAHTWIGGFSTTCPGCGAEIDALARTDEKLSLTLVNPTTVMAAFRAQDGNGYVVVGTLGASGVSWTTAAPVGGGSAAPAVDSSPAVAPGVCGDDAIAVYASSGAIRVTRLRGATWTTPETIPTIAGSRVAVATR
jgi:hypothetical protein